MSNDYDTLRQRGLPFSVIIGPDGQSATVNSDGTLAVSMAAGDIEIGAVEIKDGAADIRQTVLAASTAAAATDKAAVVALHPSSSAMNSGAVSATTLRTVLATDVGLPAGSSLIGRAAADATAATGGIPSTNRLLSASGSSGDATNVKASAGRVYAIQGANVRTSAVYLKLYNSASAPTAGSGTPVKTLYLPASSAFAFDWPLGLTFSSGIGFTLVTGSADNNSTSVTAGDILALNIDYA